MVDKKDESGFRSKTDLLKPVSAKKILYVELDEEITIIFDRIKRMKIQDIYLVVPKQALLFQSLVNLKILKRKVEEIGKNLHVITNDRNGIHLATQIGLPVYDRVKSEEKFMKSGEEGEMRIAPLKATINALEDDRPTRRSEKKVSISEIVDRSKKRKIPILSDSLSLLRKKKTSSIPETPKETKLILVSPNRKALVTLVSVSLIFLLVIFYIALPGATIIITPKSDAIEQSTNVVFADFIANKSMLDRQTPKVLASYGLDITIQRSMTHLSTGKIFQGQNARGVVTLINTRATPWQLLVKTRLQNSDGIVFRIGKPVTVPASGSLDTEVTADEFDAFGQPIGTRGNVLPMRFFLPGLSPDNQKLLYGESKAPMSGGQTLVKKQISEDDIRAATERIKKELQQAINDELQKAVNEKSVLLAQTTKFALIKGKGAVKAEDPVIQIPPDLVGKPLDQFEVTGEMKVHGVYFNLKDLLEILTVELKTKKNPEKVLSAIDEASITYRIFESDDTNKILKVTATLKGIEQYDLDSSKPAGERLIQKIKEHVLGKRLADAKDYIINLPEVSQVEIESWPVWAPTLPTVPDNIEVVLKRNM